MPVCRILIAALFGLLFLSEHACAHAILVTSEPASGTSIPAGKVNLALRYNSRIDRERSRLTLMKPDHTQSVLVPERNGPPDLLQARTEISVPGSYVIRWQVLATDGHITRGDLPFTVTGP